MSQSEKKLQPKLPLVKLDNQYVEESTGVLSRQILGRVFQDYINAYIFTAHDSGFLTPTIMFILSEKGSTEKPIAAPYTMGGYQDRELESIVQSMLLQYPVEKFTLEMVIYSKFDPGFQTKENHDILFAARDASGAHIHSIYSCHREGRFKVKLSPKKLGGALNTWIPSKGRVKKALPFEPINDKYLKAVAEIYAMTATFNNLALYE